MEWILNLALTVAGGAILFVVVGITTFIRRRYGERWQEAREDERLFRALLDRTDGKPYAAISASKAAYQAKIRDPRPALERLRRKGLIAPIPGNLGRPDYFELTRKGRCYLRKGRRYLKE